MRESLSYAFRSIFNAALCENTAGSVFPLIFDHQTKLAKFENNMNSGVVREFPPYDFQFIFTAPLCEMIRRIRFSTYFLTARQNYGSFFLRKSCHSSVNFFKWSKVNGKLNSTDHFT